MRTNYASIPVKMLDTIRRKALRKRIWFKVLNRTERAIISLTIRCVEKIRSPKLANIITAITAKLKDAMENKVKKLIKMVGSVLAQKISRIARTWGNILAFHWAKDPDFIRYLAIMHLNMPAMFQI
jgi:hypothetical protein